MRLPGLFVMALASIAMGVAPTRAAAPVVVPQDLQKTLDDLLPGMGVENPQGRSDSQQKWQDICFQLGAPGRDAQRIVACKAMAAKLGPSTAAPARIWLLKQLERLDRGEAVSAIALVLDDKDTLVRDAAIGALANIPSPAASDKLRAKLASTTDSKSKVGLVNALGFHADPASVAAIAKELANSDQVLAEAAAKALGKIGTPEAASALKTAQAKASNDLRLRIDDSLLLAADKLVQGNKATEAAAIYNELNKPTEPRSIRMAALKGVIDTSGERADAVLLAALGGKDADARDIAVSSFGKTCCGVKHKVADALATLPADGQIALLGAMASNRYKPGLASALKAVQKGSEPVKAAALKALGRLGDASTAAILIDAMRSDGDVGAAARTSLETMFAKDLDAKLIERMQQAQDLGQRGLFIEILDRRAAASAVPALLKEAVNNDSQIRRRAMSALGRLASAENVAPMIHAMLPLKDRGEREDAERAIALVCSRITEEDRQADPVLAVYNAGSEGDKSALLPTLGRIGCDKTRTLVLAALANGDGDRYEGAFAAVCNWPGADMAEQLLKLCEKPKDKDHQVRAMRAFTHAIGDPRQGSPKEKLVMLTRAMQIADSDEQRRMLIERIPSIRVIDALRLVVPLVESPKLKEPACRAIVDLAHHNEVRHPNKAEFIKALNRVIEVSGDKGLVERAKGYRDK
jgi:HEAT repeat protein